MSDNPASRRGKQGPGTRGTDVSDWPWCPARSASPEHRSGVEVVRCRRVHLECGMAVEAQLNLWGRPRSVEPRSLGREPQTLKDPGDTGWGGDGSDDRHAAGATSACKNVVQKHRPDERRPGEPSRPP